MSNSPKLETSIWHEVSDNENEFQADRCYCHGYDVSQDLLKNASWFDYLYLLISGERPSPVQSNLLEKISILMANPGIRDLSVRAAMNAGVGKAPSASVLIAALTSGSGQFGGAKELSLCMEFLRQSRSTTSSPSQQANESQTDIWPAIENIPGFDPHSQTTSKFVLDSLEELSRYAPEGYLDWLKDQRKQLEGEIKQPINLIAVLAAAFCDLKFDEEQSEYLFLMLRLPGAAAHAMEQRKLGWQKFPFFADTVELSLEHPAVELPQTDHLVQGYLNESE